MANGPSSAVEELETKISGPKEDLLRSGTWAFRMVFSDVFFVCFLEDKAYIYIQAIK